MNTDSILAQVAAPLVTLAVVVLCILGTMALNEARKLTKSKQLQALLDRVAHFGDLVVKEMNQTVVGPLKADSADGKLTLGEIDKIKTDAYAKFRQLIGEQGMAEIKASFGDAFTFISAQIEAKVHDNRSSILSSGVSISGTTENGDVILPPPAATPVVSGSSVP